MIERPPHFPDRHNEAGTAHAVPAFSFFISRAASAHHFAMLNTSSRLLATDHDKSVDLYITSTDEAYLLHRHLKVGRCLLPSPYLAHALHTIQQHGQAPMTLNLKLRPEIPGLSSPVPFVAFIGAGKRIVLGYVPGSLAQDDLECVFRAFPKLPVVVCDAVEFYANRHVYDRVMGDPERN